MEFALSNYRQVYTSRGAINCDGMYKPQYFFDTTAHHEPAPYQRMIVSRVTYNRTVRSTCIPIHCCPNFISSCESLCCHNSEIIWLVGANRAAANSPTPPRHVFVLFLQGPSSIMAVVADRGTRYPVHELGKMRRLLAASRHKTLNQCWFDVDVGPTLNQHWFNFLCLLESRYE